MNSYPICDTPPLRSVTKTVPPPLFLGVNTTPIRYGFQSGKNAIWGSVNIASGERGGEGTNNVNCTREQNPKAY